MSTVLLDVTSSVRPLGSLLVVIYPLCCNLKNILLFTNQEHPAIHAGIPLGEINRRFPADTLVPQNQLPCGNTENRGHCRLMSRQVWASFLVLSGSQVCLCHFQPRRGINRCFT